MGDSEMDRFWKTLDAHTLSDAENFGLIRGHQDRTSIALATLTVKMNIMMGLLMAVLTAVAGYLVTTIMHLASTAR